MNEKVCENCIFYDGSRCHGLYSGEEKEANYWCVDYEELPRLSGYEC